MAHLHQHNFQDLGSFSPIKYFIKFRNHPAPSTIEATLRNLGTVYKLFT